MYAATAFYESLRPYLPLVSLRHIIPVANIAYTQMLAKSSAWTRGKGRRVTLEDLKRIAASVGERRGWDFSRVRDDRDPVPWDYADVVHRYLQPSSRVLDVGTGGGERFLALTPHFGTGVGIDADPTMLRVARENTPPSLVDKVSFEVMLAEVLQFSDAVFDVVLNRHAPVYVEEIIRVLRPDGFFITQQVGVRNTENICSIFGCGPGGEYATWGRYAYSRWCEYSRMYSHGCC